MVLVVKCDNSLKLQKPNANIGNLVITTFGQIKSVAQQVGIWTPGASNHKGRL